MNCMIFVFFLILYVVHDLCFVMFLNDFFQCCFLSLLMFFLIVHVFIFIFNVARIWPIMVLGPKACGKKFCLMSNP